jgi:hypothetical protein
MRALARDMQIPAIDKTLVPWNWNLERDSRVERRLIISVTEFH